MGSHVGAAEAVRVWLLGGFSVSVGSRVVEADGWRRRSAASLVKVLALARGHRLRRERILDLLWPELDERTAAGNLHRALHFARRAFEPDASRSSARYLALVDGMVSLCPEVPLWVDAEEFEQAATAARRARDPAAYRAAIELYAGELLPADNNEEWAHESRDALRESHLVLLMELAALHEERGEPVPAIEALVRVLAEAPAREEAHLASMHLHAARGDRTRALAQYGQLARALGPGEEPGEAIRRLHERIGAGNFPAAPAPPPIGPEGTSPPTVPGNLPAPLSSFVGREIEKVEVGRDLSMTRLLTLTGAGGSGKTRLALEVARGLAGLYGDGVCLVELAPLSDPELVQEAVAQALGVREQPGQPLARTLAAHLRARHTLLVIDNCEHVVEASASLVNQLLKDCPRLRVLATSREPLGVQGESVRPVPPLAVPAEVEGGEPTVEGLMLSEAVRLFVERARSRLPEFEVTGENAPSVARACRKLDGIPLAIELAAARMGSLALEQVAQRLDVSLGFLTGGGRTVESRHRTLRATLDWSHQLLSEPEKVLFGRLSVFAGGWTLEGAEAVCEGDGIERGGVLDLLDGLVGKSLVVAEAGASRYRMLEPIRQYAAETLEDEGEASERVRRRHAMYYAAFAETAEYGLLGPDQVRWVRRLKSELANLRAAISWSLVESGDEARAELGLRLAVALWRFWDMEGFQERERWLLSGLDKGSGASPAVRAKALLGLGWTLLFKLDYGRALPALEEAVALYKGLGDDSGTAFALANLGYAVVHGGFRERIRAFVEEGEPLARGDLEGHTLAYLRAMLGCAAMAEGDPESAVSQVEEGLAMFRELGDPRGALMALLIMGMAEYERGGAERGAAALEEGARIALELGDRVGSVYYVWALGKVQALQGRPLRAAKLWGAAEAQREHMGWSLSYHDLAHSNYERDVDAARASLDEADFDAAWAEGRTMNPDLALQYALSTEEPIPAKVTPRTHTDERSSPLTGREIEVARLAAQGLTNRQIAAALSISEHTAANHVRKILKKLGLRSRTQITP